MKRRERLKVEESDDEPERRDEAKEETDSYIYKFLFIPNVIVDPGFQRLSTVSPLAQPHQCLAARAANEGPQSAPLFQANLEFGSSVINMFYRDPEPSVRRGLAGSALDILK